MNSASRLLGTAAAVLYLVATGTQAAENTQQERARAMKLLPDAAHGAQLFERCAECHASDGGGSPDGGVPDIAGQIRTVVIKQLLDYRHARRWDPRMEIIAGKHSLVREQDIADVATHVSTLPFRPTAGHGDGNDLAHGREVYGQLCAGCHGLDGGGDETKLVPRLAGQHYAYLRRQLYDAVDARRPNFSADHVRLLKRFERADFAGVSDYLSRLGEQP